MRLIKNFVLVILLLSFLFQYLDAKIYSKVSGKVVDEETGEGIKGVEVGYVTTGYRKMVITDEKGEFTFQKVPPGIGEIAFFPPAPYATAKRLDLGQRYTVEEGKTLYIVKKVIYAGILEIWAKDKKTGLPVEGVNIFIPEANLRIQSIIVDIRTDSQGLYRNERLYPGIYQEVNLRKDGFGMKVLKNIEIRSKEKTLLNVLFDSGSPTKVSGKITCLQSGNPIENIEVEISRRDEYGWSNSYSSENGYYSMFDLEPGDYDITILGYKIENDEEKEVVITKSVKVINNNESIVNFVLDCSVNYEKKEE